MSRRGSGGALEQRQLSRFTTHSPWTLGDLKINHDCIARQSQWPAGSPDSVVLRLLDDLQGVSISMASTSVRMSFPTDRPCISSAPMNVQTRIEQLYQCLLVPLPLSGVKVAPRLALQPQRRETTHITCWPDPSRVTLVLTTDIQRVDTSEYNAWVHNQGMQTSRLGGQGLHPPCNYIRTCQPSVSPLISVTQRSINLDHQVSTALHHNVGDRAWVCKDVKYVLHALQQSSFSTCVVHLTERCSSFPNTRR